MIRPTVVASSIIFLLLALLAGGCAGTICSEDSPSLWMQPGTVQPEGTTRVQQNQQQHQARLLQMMRESIASNLAPRDITARADRPVHVLMLSGGGQLGAYGAGGLVGWSEHGRPSFDVVAGVSTGALMATMAFLGPQYDHVLQTAYTTTTTKDVLERRSLLALPFTNSLATADGLRRLIERIITEDVLDAVAQEHTAGRSLWVGVVELKTGLFIPINLGAIAASDDPNRLREYHDALLASASIPVVLPPLCRHGFAYVDGATRANLFLPEVAEAMADARVQDVTLYAVINGTLNAPPQFSTQDSLIGVGSRAIALLLDEAQAGAMDRIRHTAERAGWQLHVAAIEPGDCQVHRCTSGIVNQFCREYMTCLFETAKRRHTTGTFWME